METSTNSLSGAWSSAQFFSSLCSSKLVPKRMAAEKWEDSDKKWFKNQQSIRPNNKWVTTWPNPHQSSSTPIRISSKSNKIWKRESHIPKGNWPNSRLFNKSHFKKNSAESRLKRKTGEFRQSMLKGSRHLTRWEDSRTTGAWATVQFFMDRNRAPKLRCNQNSHFS